MFARRGGSEYGMLREERCFHYFLRMRKATVLLWRLSKVVSRARHAFLLGELSGPICSGGHLGGRCRSRLWSGRLRALIDRYGVRYTH